VRKRKKYEKKKVIKKGEKIKDKEE